MDWLYGDDGADHIYGHDADDWLSGGPDRDVLDGGDGEHDRELGSNPFQQDSLFWMEY